jgi:hypothetical protein
METACIVKKHIGLKNGGKILKVIRKDGEQKIGLAKSCIKQRSSSLFKPKELGQSVGHDKTFDSLFFHFHQTYDSFEQ